MSMKLLSQHCGTREMVGCLQAELRGLLDWSIAVKVRKVKVLTGMVFHNRSRALQVWRERKLSEKGGGDGEGQL